MIIRSISCPDVVQWQAPIMSPEDVGAAVDASSLLAQADAQARRIIDGAYASEERIRHEARENFLATYGSQFNEVLVDFQKSRASMEGGLTRYADQVVKTALQRLGIVLSDEDKLRAVLSQVVSETLPDTRVKLLVSAASQPLVRGELLACGQDESRFNVEVDPHLNDDEVVLVGAHGARISCSFSQILNQLLLCM